VTGVRVLERVARNAAFGVRFQDPADGTTVVPGLVVEVYRRPRPHVRTRAVMSRSGVYVAHALPGLREFEFQDADTATLWATATRPYRVEVRDPFARFLPFAFDADLPVRGLFTWHAPWLSPPEAIVLPGDAGSPPQFLLGRVPLFSAPTRPVPGALAVVRAHLRMLDTTQPAAWSLLGVRIDGQPRGLGLADADGRVAVLFPFPEPPRVSLSSPPEARNDFTWLLELTAFVAPLTSPPLPVPALPDLAHVLALLDTSGAVIESIDSPSTPLRLTYRDELTVRTAGLTGADASFLFVTA
jgi:hypothetical protein